MTIFFSYHYNPICIAQLFIFTIRNKKVENV